MKRATHPCSPRRCSSSLSLSRTAGATDEGRPLNIYAAASLTEVFQAYDKAPAVQLRRLERARDADPEGRACRHLRLRGAAQHTAALRGRPRRQAGHVHRQPARADRAEVEPGRDQVGLRPEDEGRQARDRERGRAGRQLHAHRAEEDEPHVGAHQGGQPGIGREGRDRQGGARPGRRRLRLRHRRARRERPGDRDQDPGLGPATRALRDRGRLEVGQQGGGTGMDQGDPLRQGPDGAEERRLPAASQGVRHRQGLPGDARPRDGRRPAVPAAADRGDLPPRSARRLISRARHARRPGRAHRHRRDERRRDGADHPLRHAHRVLGRDPVVAFARPRRDADRAAARAAARRRRDRAARRLRPARAARRHVRRSSGSTSRSTRRR